MKRIRYFLMSLFLIGFLASAQVGYGQQRDSRIHSRGMLHETIFNTGEIGRNWFTGDGTDETSVPLMEWPGNSEAVIDDIRYPGQHNIVGGGVALAAFYEGANPTNQEARLFSFNGASGLDDPIRVAGVYSFPLALSRTENYPVLENGELNPDYDPNEAEEIITSKWATNLGITVTRTSRAWSYPDYDDMIIYEYTFENTGDRNGDGVSDTTATLYEVLTSFAYGLGPSMMGFQREYGTWEYDYMYKSDLRGYWDRHRWLNYVMNATQGRDLTVADSTAGKPDPDHFREFAESGEHGGGLMSPQAPGFQMLYYDRQHLADTTATIALNPAVRGSTWVSTEGTLKQPFLNKVFSGNSRPSKMKPKLMPFRRWSGVYQWDEVTEDPPPAGSNEDQNADYWVGRGAFNFRQSYKGVGHYLTFGPYTLEPGDKIQFAIAEVVGYGATEDPNEVDEGGGLGEAIDEQNPWHYPVRWNAPIYRANAEGEIVEALTDNYLKEFGYPDYVNSDVKTVKDVADKAWQAYTGQAQEPPYIPGQNSADGSYAIPVPPPAPAFRDSSDELAQTIITWGRQVEHFTHPRLTGKIDHYVVYEADHSIGPWDVVAEVPVGSQEYLTEAGEYQVVDKETTVGEAEFYAVTSVGENGHESGKTNITEREAQTGAVEQLGEIRVVPNPYYLDSGYTSGGGGEINTPSDKIGFYGMPSQATLRIYSYSGQLIKTIKHDANEYSTAWFQVSRSDQRIASGLYFFIVETPDGQIDRGKFVIIK